MNENIIERAKREIPNCWINLKGRYVYLGNRNISLPTIERGYYDFLKRVGAAYRHITDSGGDRVCEFWNPDFYQGEKLTRPLMKILPNGDFINIGKYTEMFYTEKTVREAFRLKERIEDDIMQYYEVKQLKAELAGNICAVIYMDYIFSREEYLYDGEHIKVFSVKWEQKEYARFDNLNTNFHIIIDMNRFNPEEGLFIEVPTRYKGCFMGIGYWQLKELRMKIGYNNIFLI